MSLTYKDLDIIKNQFINELWKNRQWWSTARKKYILTAPPREFTCYRKKVNKLKNIIKKIEMEQRTNY
jgi:hypothetical protein